MATALTHGGMPQWHSKRGLKHYGCERFGKSESKLYKAGEYSFRIRSCKKEIITATMQGLLEYEDKIFGIKNLQINPKKVTAINALLTITPAVISFVKEGKRFNWTLRSGSYCFISINSSKRGS